MKSRYWFLLSLLLLVGAVLCWREGERRRLPAPAREGATNATAEPTVWERFTRLPSVLTRKSPAPAAATPAPKPPALLSLSSDPHFPFRLRNSQKPEAALFRSETAVLLRNALVETLEPVNLNIPEHLQAKDDPGSWLVQARGAIDDKFRAVLRGAGVEIVSYIPNNAYLVRASSALAQQLRVSPRVQSVLPFEPYYKLDMQLLPLAIRREAMPAGRWLNIVVFPGQLEAAKEQFRSLGAVVKSQQPFPFGHVVTIVPPVDGLVALAQMPAVQNIEGYNAPLLMNDLSRVRLDVWTNTTTLSPGGQWGGLTGAGALIGLVGSGMDLAHPMLAGANFANPWSATVDYDGHETFVASVIAGRQNLSPTPTNGSIAGADYRGMAPAALLFPLSFQTRDYTNYGNIWLVTNAAQLFTNNLSIVNNSWGYPVSTYDINSALYDGWVRDSLDYLPHEQPITYVFAAGNSGNANSGGTGGNADSISSPGNAKNVITVGGSELFRLVPNSTNATASPTNDPLAIAHSDSFSQVSDLSSRGNVGVGIEGPNGRFKPDMVAPGEYVVGARASTFTNLNETDTLNMLGSQFRYMRGTSVSAGMVSGLLALMQEFFANNFAHTNKPSLNKALLINRARSLGPAYDFAVNNPVTHQGWGIPSLSNTVPSTGAIGFLGPTNSPLNRNIVIVDESALYTNQLASGQYHAFDVAVPGSAILTNQLKITLTWTDPPGNPVSSTKLVNDLDLYVTNLVANGREFEGNNIAAGTTVSQYTPPGSQSARDSVNNVENTFITLTNVAATTFRVYVVGRKVNVNSVSINGTNGVVTNTVQDYTLVIGTDSAIRNVTVSPTAAPNFAAYTNRLVNAVTNGLPYLNERVGANSPLMVANTNGTTNQWNFYVFTNQNYSSTTATNFTTNIVAGVTNVSTNVVQLPLTNGGPYVAFSTFLPPNLAKARNKEADLDLFVTRNSLAYPGGASDLTNLSPQVLSDPNTLRSTNRGGYELITVSNSSIGEIFYVGVKSEDQQGGSYGFFGAASQTPFGTNTTNGGVMLTLFPAPMVIPDGSPEAPGGVVLYGICTTNIIMQSISNLITYSHENLGDLVGTLTHNGTVITLNNHAITPGAGPPSPGGMQTYSLTYDDFLNPPDGPGDVTDLIGQDGVGLWIFEIYDNAPLMTGSVDSAYIYMRPFTNQYSTNANVFYRTVTLQAGQSFVDFFDIPVYCTNMDVDVVGGLGGVPGPVPAGQGVDLMAGVPGLVPTSASYSIGAFDLDGADAASFPHLRISSVSSANLTNNTAAPGTPPLTPGRWNFRILNNTAGQLTLTIRYTLSLDLTASTVELTYTNALISLLDNYTTNLYLTVPQDRVIAGLDVGVSILHPRVSDLVIHLVSPSGTRVLLLENRGWTNGVTTTNFYGNFSENTNYSTHVDTNGYAPLGFTDLGYLLPVKFVPGPYSAVISPPRLFTNATNLTFGHENSFGSVRESPAGLAQIGKTLVMVGKADRNGTNDAFIVSYQTPIETNRYTSNLVSGTATTNLIYLPVTNWVVTNYWTGPVNGYRGQGASGSGVNEQTFFNGVAANLDGIYAGGQTRNYFPAPQLVWSGDSNCNVYDIDLGCTAGSVNLAHISGSNPRAQVVVEYQGLPIMDYTPAPLASVTNYMTNLVFNGASRFLRVTVNPTTAATPMAWTNSLTIYRSNAVTYSVTNYAAGNLTFPATLVPNTLSAPRAAAMDVTGNVYVADSGNNRILRFGQSLSITPFVSTNATYVPLTLTPLAVGANFSTLLSPGGVAIMPNGNIVVADTGNNLIRVFTNTTGAEIAKYGDTTVNTPANAGNLDSAAPGGPSFNGPEGIAVGTNGFIYVADTGNNAIRQISNGVVTTLALPAGLLSGPRGIAVHQSTDFTVSSFSANQTNRLGTGFTSGTNLYVADTLNHRIVWLQSSNAATWNVVQLAGDTNAVTAGQVDSTNSAARFNLPSGITRDGYGNLIVSDAGSHTLRLVSPLGDVRTIAGDATGGTSGNANDDSGLTARFNTPIGLVADYFGAVFVADSGNDVVRVIAPYQTGMPTNSFITYFPFSVPTNFLMGGTPVFTTRGLTGSVFGVEYAGADSRDNLAGMATSSEGGTNFIYGVGSAQFSTNATPATLAGADRMFVTKIATNGQPVWTVGHMATAVINVHTNGAGAITNLVLGYGGTNYSAVPVVTILDPLNPVVANRAVAVTVGMSGSAVSGIVAPVVPLTGPFISPRVYVEAPTSTHMPGNGLVVAYGTNVIAVGYTNLSNIPLTTNNQPFLMCLETTNGSVRFFTNSPNSGHYNAAAVSGDKLITVGATYGGGVVGIANSNCLIEAWSISGGTQLLSAAMLPLSTTYNFGAGRPSQLSGVVAVEALDRAYAVGCVSNSATSVDAFLMEIDLTTMAVVSVITNNITNGFNFGKAITTDGVDLYLAVEGPGDGNANDRQAAVFRYRAKNFYLAEESLDAFVGQRTWGSSLYYGTNLSGSPTNYTVTNTAWRLEIADTRAGGTNGTAQVVSWNLNFTYAPSNTTALTVAPGVNNPIVLLSAAPKYFQIPVPSAATAVTNLITASGPVRVTFHPASLPLDGDPKTVQMFSGAGTGSFVVSTNASAAARLRPGSPYYLAVRAVNPTGPVNLTLKVDYNRTEIPVPTIPLTNGVPLITSIARTSTLNYYTFNVPSSASAALFEILNPDGDVNLFLSRSNSPGSQPTPSSYGYLSANPGTGGEQIFLVTNTASATALTAGTWFLGVQNVGNLPANYTLRATTVTGPPHTIVDVADAQLQAGVTSPGNAPNVMFKLGVPTLQKALVFELRDLTGPGDLIVRKSFVPLATTNNGANFRTGTLPEIVTVRTNAAMPNLIANWYFGVLNPGSSHIAYTVMARQPTNGVLLSSTPIQIPRPPSAAQATATRNFGFNLDGVPGEKYQVQYLTSLTNTHWLVLTNIIAPPDGVISFLHSGALSNRNLYYRIQVVP